MKRFATIFSVFFLLFAAVTVSAKPAAPSGDASATKPAAVPAQTFVCVEDDGLISETLGNSNQTCKSGKLVEATPEVMKRHLAAVDARQKAQQTAAPSPTQATKEQEPCQSSKQDLARARANAQAIRAAQRRCGIKADGILGPQTRKCLRRLAEANANANASASVKAPKAKQTIEEPQKTLTVYRCHYGSGTSGTPEWREGPFVCADNTAAEQMEVPVADNCPPDLKQLEVSLVGGHYRVCPATAVAGGPLLPERGAPSEPLYKKWWFWTAIGVAVAGGAAAAAYYGSQPDVKNYYGGGQQGLRF